MLPNDALARPAAVRVGTAVLSFDDAAAARGERTVAAEVAVNVAYATVPFAVMMMTPDDLYDFAVGFSLTEGIIAEAREVRGVRVEPDHQGLRLLVDLSPGRLRRHLARRRSLSGRTGCGLCGIDDLTDLPQAARPAGAAPAIRIEAVRRALAGLKDRQPLNRATGAAHAAAFADLDGTLVTVREDVGRHNALDKLIGALLRAGAAAAAGFFVVTSRCSFEMVEKVAACGGRTLVAISAPTSLALERARSYDMTLVGIARRDAMTVFNGFDRVRSEAVPA